MKWHASKRPSVFPADLYDLARQHRLVPRDLVSAVSSYKAMASMVQWWTLASDESDQVGDCLVVVMPDGTAQLDLVPVPEYFAPHLDYKPAFKDAIYPVLAEIFGQGVRRISSRVPESRGRTKKALISVGFRFEGKAIRGVQFYGREPEDEFLLAMLPDYMKEAGNELHD
jgi:hypothetical protein